MFNWFRTWVQRIWEYITKFLNSEVAPSAPDVAERSWTPPFRDKVTEVVWTEIFDKPISQHNQDQEVALPGLVGRGPFNVTLSSGKDTLVENLVLSDNDPSVTQRLKRAHGVCTIKDNFNNTLRIKFFCPRPGISHWAFGNYGTTPSVNVRFDFAFDV